MRITIGMPSPSATAHNRCARFPKLEVSFLATVLRIPVSVVKMRPRKTCAPIPFVGLAVPFPAPAGPIKITTTVDPWFVQGVAIVRRQLGSFLSSQVTGVTAGRGTGPSVQILHTLRDHFASRC